MALDWWHGGRSLDPFLIDGLAGVGKSWLTKAILEALDPQLPVVVAPTNKAARVATRKSGRKAITAHKLLYRPIDDEISLLRKELADAIEEPGNPKIVEIEEKLRTLRDSEVMFTKKSVDEVASDLIIVDERYMVNEMIGQDIQDLGIPIIATGDDFQLKPVKGKPAWGHLKPHVQLTKVERVDEESQGIVHAAHAIRYNRRIEDGPGFNKFGRGQVTWEQYPSYDVILCGTNRLRRNINDGMRRRMDYPRGLPVVGDKVISLSNHEIYDIYNGETFRITAIHDDYQRFLTLSLVDDYGEEYHGVKCWKPLFEDDSQTKMVPHGVLMMTFAYAATVHKYQGSEAPRVLVLDDWPGSDHASWVYTGVTRAVNYCALVT